MSRRLVLLSVLCVVAAALLFLPLPVPPTSAGRTLENAGHTPLFTVLTFGVLVALRMDFKVEGLRLYVLAAVFGIGGGVLTELIQMPLHRDASWEDVFDDALGVLLALAVFALFDRRTRIARVVRILAMVVAFTAATLYITPIVRMQRAYLHRDGQFPVIVDFRSPIESYWTVPYGVNRSLVRDALDVEFTAADFPGVSMFEPSPDWRGFKTLVIDIENPDADSLDLVVRVHDIGHGRDYADRFNRAFTMAPQERRTLRIALADVQRAPKGRLLDLGRISDITVFRGKRSGSRHMRIYSIRLE